MAIGAFVQSLALVNANQRHSKAVEGDERHLDHGGASVVVVVTGAAVVVVESPAVVLVAPAVVLVASPFPVVLVESLPVVVEMLLPGVSQGVWMIRSKRIPL